MAISKSGALIATGQVGTKNFKGSAAPIFLWESATRRRLTVLRGLVGCVTSIVFSDDEQFVCGCDTVSPTRLHLILIDMHYLEYVTLICCCFDGLFP